MARSVDEIYNALVAEKQGHSELDVLNNTSVTSIWRLMLYVVAYAINVLETLWDAYKSEVNTKIEAMTPHRAKWYRDKVLLFMTDMTLMQDRDVYYTTGMTEDDIAAKRVIKHATAEESGQSSLLMIKVAGENAEGKRVPLSAEVEVQLTAYINEIKDAGVRYKLINKQADKYRCEVDVYYNPTVSDTLVKQACEDAIKSYIANLPFNGVYSNMEMINQLEKIDAVKVAEVKSASSADADTGTYVDINAIVQPMAGYFEADDIVINMIPYTL